jgi:hypothetical protein
MDASRGDDATSPGSDATADSWAGDVTSTDAGDEARDDADAGEAAIPPTPGGAACLGPPACEPPQGVCCAKGGPGAFGRPWFCAASRDACPSQWDAYECVVGPAGCNAGQLCCLVPSVSSGDSQLTGCTNACAPNQRVCRQASDCPAGYECLPTGLRTSDVTYSLCSGPVEAGSP